MAHRAANFLRMGKGHVFGSNLLGLKRLRRSRLPHGPWADSAWDGIFLMFKFEVDKEICFTRDLLGFVSLYLRGSLK